LSRDSTLDRVLSALNHPIRRRILRDLAAGPASASRLSRSFGIELGVVSYHLNTVLAKQCEVVELVESVPRRGSMEKIYRLRGAPEGSARCCGVRELG
jgi:DNA-binding transcriptional ArsR family regulator